jgi:hypothetical protein
VKRLPPWSVRIRQRAWYGVSDASHACGLDDLNAGVGQQVPGLPASAQHPAPVLGWRRPDTLLVSGGLPRARDAGQEWMHIL